MSHIQKTVSNEIKKWQPLDQELYKIKRKIGEYYRMIKYKDCNKKYFIRLHYLKMLKDYIYLKAYHCNIKTISSNEKLLRYFESILSTIGLDFISMIKFFYKLEELDLEQMIMIFKYKKVHFLFKNKIRII